MLASFSHAALTLLRSASLIGAAFSLLMVTSLPSYAIDIEVDTGGRPVLDYLPENVDYNPAIPTPESVLGMQLGEWHVRHDQLVHYLNVLADASDRMTIKEMGRTHENRPLLLLTITAPHNHAEIETLRQRHLSQLASGSEPSENAPLILYMGYSIHGNEPSGSNAALAVAYYLAAAQGEAIDTLLTTNVVLLDPSFNPDGLSRFAQWANMHKGTQLVADSLHREHNEGWPSGRTNHYWFDLNRDWLLLAHPESKARIAQFHRWRPHVLTDFHEMGTNSSYFFQPGVRARKNPLTPDANVTLTEALASFHARALDGQNELYFTEEAYDDFYAGKGSTYPDLHGSVGILFEQARSRGHLQASINGNLAFADTIANQVTTSLSTFAGAVANKPALLQYQSSFVGEAQKLAKQDKLGGYLLAMPDDLGRFSALTELLSQHQVVFHVVPRDVTVDSQTFQANRAIYIPLEQYQYRLVKSLFSTQTSFEDNTFYDVSSWHIALAFNVDYTPVTRRQSSRVKWDANAKLVQANPMLKFDSNAYAYAFSWHDYYAPALLQSLLEAGVKVRSSQNSFTAHTQFSGEVEFPSGSIVIPAGPARLKQPNNLVSLIKQKAQPLGMSVYGIKSGLTPAGSDLGSRGISPISMPKVLIVGGKGTREYEVGEMWHYFDTRVGLPTTIIEQRNLLQALQGDYTHILFPSGRFELSQNTKDILIDWVKQGGVLIGQKSALRYFSANSWLNIDVLLREEIDNLFKGEGLSYKDRASHGAQKLVAGAVYEAEIDTSHPLFFGYTGDTLAMFKTSNMIIDNHYSPFTTPARYTEAPLMAGFSADPIVKLIAKTPAVVTTNKGKGLIIGFVDNTQFRGYWYGTNKMLSNAIYQSHFLH